MKKKYVSKLISETPGLTANVISLDAAMRNALETSSELKALKDKLEQMKKSQSKSVEPDNKAWAQAIQNIKDKIKETSANSRLRMYLVESAELVDTYKKILKQPIKMSFMGPVKASSNEKDILEKKIYEDL